MTQPALGSLDKADFDDKVRALVAQGHSRESAERIVGAMVRDEGKTRKSLVVTKIDTDKRLVTAITGVLSDGLGKRLVDHDGDVMDIDDFEDALINTLERGGTELGGEMHETAGGADIVEAHTLSTDVWKAITATLQPQFRHVPDLSKMPEFGLVTFRVTDDALWKRVKAGYLPEISIEAKEGDASRSPLHA